MARLHRWIWLMVIVGGLLLISGAVLTWWWYDDSDLRAVKERASSLGVSLSGAEGGRLLTVGERLAIWNEVAALTEKPSMHSFSQDGKPETLHRQFTPLSPALRARHEAYDPVDLNRLMSLIDQFGTDPVIHRLFFRLVDRSSELGQYRRLGDLLCERILLAPRERIEQDCRRLLGLIATIDTYSMQSALTQTNLFTRAMRTINERLCNDRSDYPEIFALMKEMADQLPGHAVHGAAGEFLLLLDFMTHPPSYATCRNLGVIADGSWDCQPTPWMFRTGRRYLLDTQLDWLLLLREKPTIRTSSQFAKDLEEAPYRTWELQSRLARHFRTALAVSVKGTEYSRLYAHLLNAELRAEPWPIDTFDPLQRPLRRFERDGKVIGAYSVGEDGVDDGGKKSRDYYFPLYGPLELPVSPGP